jgi:nucleoside-diphosphate-sugar epimerase
MKEQNQYCPEIVTICPSAILGEVIGGGDQTTSTMVRRMMLNEMPGMPPLYFTCVDVKDVALAHLRAITRQNAANQRFILCDKGGYTMLELAD